MLVVLENGRVVLEVDLPIEVVESIHYERGMLTVNDYLIGVVSPSKAISVQVLNGMSGESNVSDDFQLPIEPRIKWEEPEIKPEEPERSEEIKPEEPEIKKVKKEESIFVDEEEQKGALYGFLGGGLAGTVVGGIASALTNGLGQTLTTTSNSVQQLTDAEVPFSQSTNVVDNIVELIKNFFEHDEIVSTEDREPLINRSDADGEDMEQRPIKREPTDGSPQTDGGNNVQPEEGESTSHQTEAQMVHQSMEQELNTPFETLEPIEAPPIEEPTYTDVPENVYEQAMTHKPQIHRHYTSGIPIPAYSGPSYPSRNMPVERWTAERWAKQRHAHELSMQLREDQENLREFGESVARAIHLNRNQSKVTLNEIKNNLSRYATRRPHTRSETATGRRSDLLELPLDKNNANYEPLMEAIRKWQNSLRNYTDKSKRFENIKKEYDLNKFFPK